MSFLKLRRAIAEFLAPPRINANRGNANDAEAHYNLGVTLGTRGDLEGTITEYLAALRINPNLVEGHNNLAIALRMKGDLAGAIAEFRAMLSINPNNANAHSELGATLISYDLKRQYAVRWHQAMNGRAEILCRRGAIPLSSPQGRTMKRYGEEVTISAYVVRRALRGKSY